MRIFFLSCFKASITTKEGEGEGRGEGDDESSQERERTGRAKGGVAHRVICGWEEGVYNPSLAFPRTKESPLFYNTLVNYTQRY